MKRKNDRYDVIMIICIIIILISILINIPNLFTTIEVEATSYTTVEDTTETIEQIEVPTYAKVSDTYNVGSEGVSTHYYNTTINGVRNGETDVITSTQDVPGLGEDICVGRPLDNDPTNPQYACVVLPESLSDTYGRGDIVLVEYDDGDGINGIIPCVVIDFNQTEHGDHLNFVGDFHPPYGATAWIVEEE